MKIYKNIITDLDGTLLECAKYYLDVQNTFADFQASRTGLPWDLCLNVLKNIDLACTALPDAFSAERFPRSFKAASMALDVLAGQMPDKMDADRSYHIGNGVFYAEYPLYRGVMETLEAYRAAGVNLAVLTKGEDWVQDRKLVINGLKKFFGPLNTYIVLKKDGDSIRKILRILDFNPDETIMVGDSERDDIGAAVAAGIDSVLVSTGTRWAYEDGHGHRPTYHIPSFSELPSVVPLPLTADVG